MLNINKYQFLPYLSNTKNQIPAILHTSLFGNLTGPGKESFNVTKVISEFNRSFNGTVSYGVDHKQSVTYLKGSVGQYMALFCGTVQVNMVQIPSFSGVNVYDWGLPCRTHGSFQARASRDHFLCVFGLL